MLCSRVLDGACTPLTLQARVSVAGCRPVATRAPHTHHPRGSRAQQSQPTAQKRRLAIGQRHRRIAIQKFEAFAKDTVCAGLCRKRSPTWSEPLVVPQA